MQGQVSFGNWLRPKRKALDLTREGLADFVGCSAITIRKLEADERNPPAQIAERIAQIFDIAENEQKSFIRFARGDWKSASSKAGVEPLWRAAVAAGLGQPERAAKLYSAAQAMFESGRTCPATFNC